MNTKHITQKNLLLEICDKKGSTFSRNKYKDLLEIISLGSQGGNMILKLSNFFINGSGRLSGEVAEFTLLLEKLKIIHQCLDSSVHENFENLSSVFLDLQRGLQLKIKELEEREYKDFWRWVKTGIAIGLAVFAGLYFSGGWTYLGGLVTRAWAFCFG